MNHLDRQQLADVYASTHTIAVIGASADPGCGGLGTQNWLTRAPSPSAPSTLPGVQARR